MPASAIALRHRHQLAAELKAQRAKRGWTRVETGEKIGYSGSYVSDIERGARLASLEIAWARP